MCVPTLTRASKYLKGREVGNLLQQKVKNGDVGRALISKCLLQSLASRLNYTTSTGFS